ncbi:extracellular solute-binding protein [Paenibacillus sp. IITD108]|uniref:extracellular solute-binding protein n=1 Tax=Paenibacillus sp. IITD108 TaxID=3116649 RepID=UPI002F3E3462
MKIKQKWFIVSLILSFLVVTACKSQEKPEVDHTAVSPSPKETTITYDIFLNRGDSGYPDNGGEGRQLILDALNKAGISGVDYKVTLTSGQEYFTKLNLMIAGGKVPDYFSVDQPTMMKLADEGLIMPLDDLLKDMPQAMAQMLPEDLESATYNGKIYALPDATRTESFNGRNVSGLIVRQDWLDKLDLNTPRTLDQFYEAIKKFTLDDPDGNSVNDTYGLGGYKPTGFGSASGFEAVFGAYGVLPPFWIERDGMIKQGLVLPETKEVLSILQSWYKEGLIDPEFPVTSDKQLEEKIVNSKVGIANRTAWIVDPTNAVQKGIKELTPSAELTILVPPTGPGGSGLPEQSPGAKGLRAVSAKVKDPTKLAKLLNWTASDKADGGFMLTAYGVEGKDYTFDQESNLIIQTSSSSELVARGLSNPVQFIKVTDRRWSPKVVLDALKVSNDNTLSNALWVTVPAQLEYPDLVKLWEEYFIKIVTGEFSVDKWEELVQKYYSQGGKEIEEQANAEWKKINS